MRHASTLVVSSRKNRLGLGDDRSSRLFFPDFESLHLVGKMASIVDGGAEGSNRANGRAAETLVTVRAWGESL